MRALPIIDLLIFLGWTTLASGGVLKAIYITTSYRPRPAGLDAGDLPRSQIDLRLVVGLDFSALNRRLELRLERQHRGGRSILLL